MVDNKFSTELPRRVKEANPTPQEKAFADYVRRARYKLGIDRATLASRSGVDRAMIAFLENNLLLRGEFTEELVMKINAGLKEG